MNKKEYERWDRERAKRKAKARSDSKDRQEMIKVRWGLDKQQFKGAKNSTEIEKLKREKVKRLMVSIRELIRTYDLNELGDDLIELAELASLQDREIEFLTQFRRDWERIEAHYPEELENLSSMSSFAELKPYVEEMLAKRKPKETYERRRRTHKWNQMGEIEREFAGGTTLSEPVNWGLAAFHRQQGIFPLLDNIFAGQGVSMLRLQELFGVHRNRFPRNLPNFTFGRERLYDYRAVTEIMDAFLSEKAPTRKASKRGRPAGQWLSHSPLRALVLRRIEARIKSISVPEHIAHAFRSVVHRHMPTLDLET